MKGFIITFNHSLVIRSLVIVSVLFLVVCNEAFAQQGRHELPLDTVPIGGEEQKIKEEKMEAHDQLTADLISVRDSISNRLDTFSSDENGVASKSLQTTKAELDRMIKALKRTDRNQYLTNQGQILLEESRRTLKGIK